MASIRIKLEFSQNLHTPYIGFRSLHKGEGGYPNPEGMPIVRPSENAPPIDFTEPVQKLSFLLNRNNPNLTGDKWRVVYGNGTAFTNKNGFDKDGDPRADFINRRNLGEDLPKLMKAIICGGMFIRGIVGNNRLICRPGVHGIDARPGRLIPTVEEVLRNNWYFTATTGGRDRVGHFPQGGGLPVLIPYFLIEDTEYPMIDDNGFRWFEKWEKDYLPDPTRIYNPI